jgi:predicted peptidase
MYPTGVQQPHTFRWSRLPRHALPYLLFLPAAYTGHAQRWPVLLFLHGAGERGYDLQRVKRHGVAHIVEEQPDFPFVVVSPQCPPREAWAPAPLLALLDAIAPHYDVDPERCSVTGLSMGGFGTWAVALAAPARFAAMAPICGGGDPARVSALRHLPVWAFHGARDPIVPLQRSVEMVEALRQCGGNVRFTV